MEDSIDPLRDRIPKKAVIKTDKLPDNEHAIAAKRFLVADGIASGVAKDWEFVKKIPRLIELIIDNKNWECFYVSECVIEPFYRLIEPVIDNEEWECFYTNKCVVEPFYCCYTQSGDAENFQSFVEAKRPYGLGTTLQELDSILQIEPRIYLKFRCLIDPLDIEFPPEEFNVYLSKSLVFSAYMIGEITEALASDLLCIDRWNFRKAFDSWLDEKPARQNNYENFID